MTQGIISADDHLDLRWLPPDLWTERLPSKLKERAPHIEEAANGPTWFCDGRGWGRWGTYKSQGDGTKWAIEAFGELKEGELRPTIPDLRLKDMDRDGVDATVMYGHTNDFPVEDPQLREAVYAAYNDWVWDFCSYAPNRLVSVAQLPAEDPVVALSELERAARTGFKHVNVMAAIANPPIYCEEWEPFWKVAEETRIPVGFHLAVRINPPPARVPQSVASAVQSMLGPQQLNAPIAGLILTGVLDRYPGLKLVMAESGIAWVPFMIQRLDASYRKMREGRLAGTRTTACELKPSEYFTRQIWMTFQDDPAGVKMLNQLPQDKVMWASDYPHPASTWPHSKRIIEEQTEGLSPELKQKILCDNARALYGLN
ncbi:MAG: amidohydrolase [Chloroflexi bacterium]|nr:amidohydrolase [Chloroflexota bacterium]